MATSNSTLYLKNAYLHRISALRLGYVLLGTRPRRALHCSQLRVLQTRICAAFPHYVSVKYYAVRSFNAPCTARNSAFYKRVFAPRFRVTFQTSTMRYAPSPCLAQLATLRFTNAYLRRVSALRFSQVLCGTLLQRALHCSQLRVLQTRICAAFPRCRLYFERKKSKLCLR